MKFQSFLGMLLMLFAFACSKEKPKIADTIESPKMFELISPSHSNVEFKNQVTESLYFNFLNYAYVYNGGGVAVGDINNDGLEDLYFTSNQGSNKLYLNKGNFEFEDITEKAGVADKKGWATGVSMIDINADGWLDIYVCKSGSLQNHEQRKNQLFVNQKDGTFIEQGSQYGLNSMAFSTQAYYLDFDKDGDLDVYLVNHRHDFNNNVHVDPRIQKDIRPESTDQLFENKNGTFTNITQKAGVLNKAWGLSASIGDFNEDGWPDIYVANDFLEPDFLYINNQDGTFTDRILETFDHIAANSMGSDLMDINNDLKPDLVVLDMVAEDHQRSKENMASMSTENFEHLISVGYHHQYMSNMLQLNLGNGTYSEIGQLAGIAKSDWSWGPLLADFNNDGYNDLFVTNGILHDLSNQDFRNQMKANIMNRKKVTLEQAIGMMPSTKIGNKMFVNNQDLTFSAVEKPWGLDHQKNANGVAYADLDNDGDLDIITNNQMETASLYRNNQDGNAITIALIGDKTNPNAIGSKVIIHAKEEHQAKEVYRVRGFQSSVSHRLHFGLGAHTMIDSIKVVWPNGTSSVRKNIQGNQQLYIEQVHAEASVEDQFTKESSFFRSIDPTKLGVTFEHKEALFDDFALQLLLPQKQSEKGAALAVADVNNDGLDDFFVGNAKGAVAALYLQNKDGSFTNINAKLFASEASYEDTDALFFDAEGDGDLDLYVSSGSYEDADNSPWLQDRLYLNDGQGQFVKSNQLPNLKMVTATVEASDIDEDGDLDLFVGGGAIPGKYPMAYPSKILINNKGNFTDLSSQVAEGFDQLTLVNEAVFSDYDQDGDQDLMVVGEWMPVRIFNNEKGRFIAAESDLLAQTSGWNFSITATDLDGDSDMDYLIGNLGTNNKFQPKEDKPFHIYAKDFDTNGSMDIVLSKESKEGVLLPVRGKECSSQQVPSLNQKFKTYSQFASASLIDIYGQHDLSEALHYTANTFESFLLKNNGNGTFKIESLPNLAQLGPTTDMVVQDFNNDGHKDLFAVGSIYEAEVETIRYDANKGCLLFGNATGLSKKTYMPSILQGSQSRAVEMIQINGRNYVLILNKNGPVSFLEVLQ